MSFGSLDKTFISNHSEYREVVNAGVQDCFEQLKASHPAMFSVQVSHRDSAFEAFLQEDVPAFADALASLISEVVPLSL